MRFSRHGGLWAAVFFLCLSLVSARAHDIFSSYTDATIHDDRVQLNFLLSRASALRLVPDGNTLPPITPENFPDYVPRLKGSINDLYELSVGGQAQPLISSEVKIAGEDDVEYILTFSRPPEGKLRILGLYLQYLVDGHTGTLVVMGPPGVKLGWAPISYDQPFLEVPLPPPGAVAPAAGSPAPAVVSPPFGTWVKLGVHHILIGYDHLLFLLGLIVACQRFRTMAGIITFFTLAHSITLAMAAFDIVTLSPRIVEPLIAASIVFVGVENLLLRGREPKHRGALTFTFGLIHGFGFAGALKEVAADLSGAALAMPLFSFNLGVELGQLAVAAVCLPLLLLFRRNRRFAVYGPPLISGLVAVAGGFWLLQRTVL